MNYKYFIYAATAMGLVACSSDNDEAFEAPVALTVQAEIAEVLNTRATATSFESNDAIGVSVKEVATGGTTAGDNVKYVAQTTSSSSTVSFAAASSPIYFKDAKKVTFSGYFPYNENVSADAPSITQSTATQSEQAKFDFLYGTGEGSIANTSGIKMTFSHVMAKLSFTFAAGNGVSADDLATNLTAYTVDGLVLDGSFNTKDGTTALTENATAATLTPGIANKAIIVYPQTPSQLKVTLTYSGVGYVATATVPTAGFEKGKNYTYTLTLNQQGLQISSTEITDWTTVAQTGTSAEYEYPDNILQEESTYNLGWGEEQDLPYLSGE
jgi:hypothetical protein